MTELQKAGKAHICVTQSLKDIVCKSELLELDKQNNWALQWKMSFNTTLANKRKK